MKHTLSTRSKRIVGGLGVVVLLALVLTLTTQQLAFTAGPLYTWMPGGETTSQPVAVELIPAVAPNEPLAPTADDGGPWEVGAHAAGGNLASYAASEATYLYNRLRSCGWTGRYNYGTSLAWEEDFKRTALGGTEPWYLDTVDLQFYVGHGGPGGFTFDPPYHDDSTLTPNDCWGAWGDGDNEWVALTSCQVLANSNRAQWASCMRGTHLILGFITNAAARLGTATQGYRFANYLCSGWTVTGAWFKACDVSQPAGRKVRVLAEEQACFSDRPSASSVCSDAWDNDYWYWDHSCGSELPRQVDVPAQSGVMPVFRTEPLSLAEAEESFAHLGAVFGLPSHARATSVSQDTGIWRSEANGRELEMDPNSGIFGFYDMENLWSGEQIGRVQAAGANRITQDDARAIADAFLRENGLMPSDAAYYETAADTVSSAIVEDGVEVATVVDEEVTAWQVIYSRVVSAPRLDAASGQIVNQEFLVVGPGAKLKVYVDAVDVQASVNISRTIRGALGGWHRLLARNAAQSPAAVETIPILTPEQIYLLHEQLESNVVINTTPLDADGRQILSHTLAYWEEGMGHAQSELVPVYALNIHYTRGAEDLGADYAYIPANPIYMRPYAAIASVPQQPVRVGEEISLVAVDAAKTLADLGFPASLNFALGSGDYIYDWYVDSVDEANRIGSGRSIRYVVGANALTKESMNEQAIILRVTDIGTGDQRSTVADTMLTVYPRTLMPLMWRQ